MRKIRREARKFYWLNIDPNSRKVGITCENSGMASWIACYETKEQLPESACIAVCGDDPYGIVIMTNEKNPQLIGVMREEDMRRDALGDLIDTLSHALYNGFYPFDEEIKFSQIGIVFDDVYPDLNVERFFQWPSIIISHAVTDYDRVAAYIGELKNSPYEEDFYVEINSLEAGAKRDGVDLYDFMHSCWPKTHAYTIARRFVYNAQKDNVGEDRLAFSMHQTRVKKHSPWFNIEQWKAKKWEEYMEGREQFKERHGLYPPFVVLGEKEAPFEFNKITAHGGGGVKLEAPPVAELGNQKTIYLHLNYDAEKQEFDGFSLNGKGDLCFKIPKQSISNENLKEFLGWVSREAGEIYYTNWNPELEL